MCGPDEVYDADSALNPQPCPCCGSDSVERERDSRIFAGQVYLDRYAEPVASQHHGFRNRCNACGLQTCWWHHQDEADEAWNRRCIENA